MISVTVSGSKMSKRGSDPRDKPIDRPIAFQQLKSLSQFKGFFPVSLGPQYSQITPRVGSIMLFKVATTPDHKFKQTIVVRTI
jgi:hypothetical protein